MGHFSSQYLAKRLDSRRFDAERETLFSLLSGFWNGYTPTVTRRAGRYIFGFYFRPRCRSWNRARIGAIKRRCLRMTTRGVIPHPDHVDPGRRAKEQAALYAVLTSGTFENRVRLANLLKYICERYFAGDTDAIKEYCIATDVFNRSPSFDQATDSIVRVEVFRLRKKLREFYDGEGADQPIEIVVATGHYRPQFVDRIPQARLQNRLADSAPTAAQAEPEPLVET